jgi:hypothetical protein
MSLGITEGLIARQPPEAQTIIPALLATIRQLRDQLNQSPLNSSVPPSTEHPHAKPPRPKSRRPAVRVVSLATAGMSVRSSLRDSATQSSL